MLEDPRHEKFCLLLLAGKGQGDAYLEAGYKAKNEAVAAACASRLLRNAKIQMRLAQLKQEAADKATLSKSWVIERLMENAERALQAKPVLDAEGKETGEYKYEGSVANRALELLGKEQGMFVDRKEVGGPGDFKALSDEELDAEIAKYSTELQEQRKGTRH